MEDHTFEDFGELLMAPDAARFLNSTERTLENWRMAGDKGPPFVRVGGQVRYPYKWLRQWLLDNAECPDGNCAHVKGAEQ